VSETTIFLIGAVIFAMTVYGSVMAGGLALTRIGSRQDPPLDGRADRSEAVATTDDLT
jgi:hypothetical protein